MCFRDSMQEQYRRALAAIQDVDCRPGRLDLFALEVWEEISPAALRFSSRSREGKSQRLLRSQRCQSEKQRILCKIPPCGIGHGRLLQLPTSYCRCGVLMKRATSQSKLAGRRQ